MPAYLFLHSRPVYFANEADKAYDDDGNVLWESAAWVAQVEEKE